MHLCIRVGVAELRSVTKGCITLFQIGPFCSSSSHHRQWVSNRLIRHDDFADFSFDKLLLNGFQSKSVS